MDQPAEPDRKRRRLHADTTSEPTISTESCECERSIKACMYGTLPQSHIDSILRSDHGLECSYLYDAILHVLPVFLGLATSHHTQFIKKLTAFRRVLERKGRPRAVVDLLVLYRVLHNVAVADLLHPTDTTLFMLLYMIYAHLYEPDDPDSDDDFDLSLRSAFACAFGKSLSLKQECSLLLRIMGAYNTNIIRALQSLEEVSEMFRTMIICVPV